MHTDDLRGTIRALKLKDVQSLVPDKLSAKMCPECKTIFPQSKVVCDHHGRLLYKPFLPQLGIKSKITDALTKRGYALKDYAAEGDLSFVFEGLDLKTNASVVIKVIKPHMLGNSPKRIARFVTALRETLALKHNNIISILDVGVTSETNPPTVHVFFVLEKIDAVSLKNLLADVGRLPPNSVREVMHQVCNTLAYAEQGGWLHGDLKPSNIFVSMDNDELQVKLSDFGVAERMFRNLEWTTNATKTGSVYGNANYIAPESCFENTRGVGSEIYSLGCIMYHLLAGVPPFVGLNDFSTLLMHRDNVPAPFHNDLHIDAKLESLVMKCLDKNPKNRFESFSALIAALEKIA